MARNNFTLVSTLMMLLFVIMMSFFPSFVTSSCYNHCNNHGTCNSHSICVCNSGWRGAGCTERVCYSGPQISGMPNQTDNSHQDVECSGNGRCNVETGLCECNKGFSGLNCARKSCFNDCNGHGKCLSMKDAATLNDGNVFDKTTTYTRWDASVIHGCKCDPGWEGADCSQRSCPWGPDPRAETYPYQFVTLVCYCSTTCKGKFKLQYLGTQLTPWFKPSSMSYEIANAMMKVPGVWANTSMHSTASIVAYNGTSSTTNNAICNTASYTTTKIRILRTTAIKPTLSISVNAMAVGTVYFKTKQVLQCNCELNACNGTFRLAFEGEISSRLHTWYSASSIVTALNAMSTFTAAGFTASSTSSSTYICLPGAVTNYTITITGSLGNAPRISLISSVVPATNPSSYSTVNATADYLSILTNDGRDDFLKLCNGIGRCNFDTGECTCPWGWQADPLYGPCGRLDVNSSTWGGFSRCPGVVQQYSSITSSAPVPEDQRPNRKNRFFMSFNAVQIDKDMDYANKTHAFIAYLEMESVRPIFNKYTVRVVPTPFLNMSSNTSAGPLFVDYSSNYLFFMDLHEFTPFIGKVSLDLADPSTTATYSWLSLTTHKVNAMTADVHWRYRKLYWTVSNTEYAADGAIYWCYMDASSPTAYSLTSTLGQANVVDPTGIAIHYIEQKIYYLDKASSSSAYTRLLKFNRDGSGLTEVIKYTTQFANYNVSGNSSELFIDYQRNNTAFFMDLGGTDKGDRAIIATKLDAAQFVNNSNTTDFFKYMYRVRIIAQDETISMGLPWSQPHFFMDDNMTTFYFSDNYKKTLNYVQYEREWNAFYNLNESSTGESYRMPSQKHQPYIPYYPVGMAIDRGLSAPTFGNTLDCYGNGVCQGLSGNWTCSCNEGFYGDCQARTCPKGKAWFHEPQVDEIAHDVDMECSNMGVCDRKTGRCKCRNGFEGNACERYSCPMFSDADGNSLPCASFGRCLSLRDLATHHTDESFDSAPLEYGRHTSDMITWDADKLHACLPDNYGYFKDSNITSGFPGQLDCPYGYNIRALDERDRNKTAANFTNYQERQRLKCKADSGYFTVTFRGKTSAKIYPTYTSYQMATVLSAVPTIGPVRIVTSTSSSTDAVCDDSRVLSRYVVIYFQGIVGSAPLLTADDTYLRWRNRAGRVAISSVQAATTYGLLECSGMGKCNRNTGVCECWPHWVSSDGYGNKGKRGDCGISDIL